MKRIILILLIACCTLPAYAQKNKRHNSKAQQSTPQNKLRQLQEQIEKMSISLKDIVSEMDEEQKAANETAISNLSMTSDSLITKISNINKQIETVTQEINKTFSLRSAQVSTFNKTALSALNSDIDSLTQRISTLNESIITLQNVPRNNDILKNYYNDNIDTLFAHTNLQTLKIHKDILGRNHPAVMNDLQTMSECDDALRKAYNANNNKQCIEKLGKVQECMNKKQLMNALINQKDISAEVDHWIKEEAHTIYSLMLFSDKLQGLYGVQLRTQYPFLYNMAFEALKKEINKRQANK